MAKCKRCGMKTALDAETIQKMVNDVAAMPGIRLVGEDVYQKRIAVCEGCEKFEYGSTCMLCGCVMQVRARLSGGKCPYPGKSRW